MLSRELPQFPQQEDGQAKIAVDQVLQALP